MKVKRYAIISAAVTAAIAGSAGAVAATRSDDAKKTEQAVLDDAAKRLNVTPEQLRGALSAAEDAQLDQAVKDGKLTQQQADAIKQRRQQDGQVLGLPGGPGFGHGHGGPGGPGGPFFGPDVVGAAAKALGLSTTDLEAKLRDGQTLSAIAKAQSKDLADVKAAVKQAVTDRLDADVKAGRLTDAQRKDMLSHLDDELDELATRTFHGPRDGGRGPGRHWG